MAEETIYSSEHSPLAHSVSTNPQTPIFNEGSDHSGVLDSFVGSMTVELEEKFDKFEDSGEIFMNVTEIQQLGSDASPKKTVNSDGFSEICINVQENYVANCEASDGIVKNVVDSNCINKVCGHEFQEKNVTFEGSDDLNRIVFEIRQLSSDEFTKKMVGMDETGQVSEAELVKEEVGFGRNEEISEYLELRHEVRMMGRENSSGANSEIASFMLRSDKPVLNKTVMNIQRIDDTVVLEISEIEKVSNGKGGIQDSCNAAAKSEKIRYSRKELEKLRFVGGKERQNKVWQDVYNGFSEDMKKEYDELGSLKQKKHGGAVFDHHYQTVEMRNNNDRGILGVPAASGRCNCPSIFFLKRASIVNC